MSYGFTALDTLEDQQFSYHPGAEFFLIYGFVFPGNIMFLNELFYVYGNCYCGCLPGSVMWGKKLSGF